MTNIHANESEKKQTKTKATKDNNWKTHSDAVQPSKKKVDENVWEKKKQICTAITEIVYNVIAATCYNRR